MEIANPGGSNIVHTKRNRKARKVSRPGKKDEKFVEYKEESYASSSGGMRISFKGAERPFGAIGNFRQKKKNAKKRKKGSAPILRLRSRVQTLLNFVSSGKTLCFIG